MPVAYIIVDIKINDPEQFKQYMAVAPAAVKAAGGEYLVRGGRHEVLEQLKALDLVVKSKPYPESTMA